MSGPPRGAKGEPGRAPDRPGGGQGPSGPRQSGPRPKGPGRPRQRQGGPPTRRPGQKPGSIGLGRIGGNDFELVHPRGVKEMELDYEEGMELWKAGDPESARDALRYALAACHDNLWVHAALGRIALEEFHDPSLAQGHFGYAVELGPRHCRRISQGGCQPIGPPTVPSSRPSRDCCVASKHWGGAMMSGICALRAGLSGGLT